MALRSSDYGDVAAVYHMDPSDDADWAALADLLAEYPVDQARGPIDKIVETVRSRGCRSVIFERRYMDIDYRSEYSAFWSGRFEDRPAQAIRIHFFADDIEVAQLPELPEGAVYLGYCVYRPTQLGPIGRTVVVPPASPADLTGPRVRLTAVVDRPSLFGHPLEVHGVPFCQQDGELLRCAHAAAWICHYVAFHRRIVARRLTAEIASIPSVEGSKHRPLPSTGLTGEQLQGVFSAINIPAFFYEVGDLPRLPADFPEMPELSPEEYEDRVDDERVFRVVCKYLNSGFPVVVLAESNRGNHALTLVGWEPIDDEGNIRLIACDDQVGPYETIESPSADGPKRGKWKALMVPLPSKVYLTGEAAENRARQIVAAELDQAGLEQDPIATDLAKMAPSLEELRGPISVRSRLMESRRYKAVAGRQGRHDEAVRIARMANLPHWVWVVEFQDRPCRKAGKPCVKAEVVFDATSHDEVPTVAVLTTASVAIDAGALDEVIFEDVDEVEDETAAGDAGTEIADDSDEQDASWLWHAELDGRQWRSLIADEQVSDREYGGTSVPDA